MRPTAPLMFGKMTAMMTRISLPPTEGLQGSQNRMQILPRLWPQRRWSLRRLKQQGGETQVQLLAAPWAGSAMGRTTMLTRRQQAGAVSIE